jgi:ribose 5-phosphate isomerase A
MHDKDAQKLAVGREALSYIVPGSVLGVGSGSTVNAFISLLGPIASQLKGAVAASSASAQALGQVGIPVLDLNEVDEIPVYVDGADEIDPDFNLIKGGGAALTREKIIASASRLFVCVVDESKLVPRLGSFPLPLEVIPLATRFVCSRIVSMGGQPKLRSNVTTDNGNCVVDVTGLSFEHPPQLETELNQIPGVVCNGIFGHRKADVAIAWKSGGIATVRR